MSNHPPMSEESLYCFQAESDPALNELLRVSASLSECVSIPIRRSASDDLRSDEDYGASWFQENSEESIDLRNSLHKDDGPENLDYQSLPNAPPLSPYAPSFVLSRSRPTSIEKSRFVPESSYAAIVPAGVLVPPHHEYPPGYHSHHHPWRHETVGSHSQESMPMLSVDLLVTTEQRPMRIDYELNMDGGNLKSDKACNAAYKKETVHSTASASKKPGLSVDAQPFVPNTYRIMSSIV